MEILSVPIIVAAVYALIEIYKRIIPSDNIWLKNIIPVIAVVLGTVFGIILYAIDSTIIAAGNYLAAALVGAASGLGATGTHQIGCQLLKIKSVTKKDGAAPTPEK